MGFTSNDLRAEDLRVLLAAVTALSSARTISEITNTVASAVRQLCQADGVAVVLRERDQVLYVDEQSVSPLWKGRRFPASSCVSGWCMHHRETAVIRDVYADARIAQDLYRPTFVKSLVMTPLRRSDPVGALGAYWAAERAPSEREVGLVQTLADAAAIAMDNARLYLQLSEALHVSSVQAERREEFVRWLSHDLRTPLAAISMSCAAVVPLLEQNTPVSMTGARAQLGNIRRATDRMDRLIHDLLDIAALDAGVLKLEKKSTPLSEVLETAYELAPLAEERGITLVADAPGAMDIYVSCDVHRVAQVINNLVANAIQHAEGATNVLVTATSEPGAIRFRVEDNGSGFVDAERSLSVRTKLASSGLGLGLTIARGIVEAHGGLLTTESTIGGAVVHFTVPTL